MEVVLRTKVVLVQGIFFDSDDHCIRVDEPRHVIDMAVRVVTHTSFTKPDRMANP